jgi:hypothetical protein
MICLPIAKAFDASLFCLEPYFGANWKGTGFEWDDETAVSSGSLWDAGQPSGQVPD